MSPSINSFFFWTVYCMPFRPWPSGLIDGIFTCSTPFLGLSLTDIKGFTILMYSLPSRVSNLTSLISGEARYVRFFLFSTGWDKKVSLDFLTSYKITWPFLYTCWYCLLRRKASFFRSRESMPPWVSLLDSIISYRLKFSICCLEWFWGLFYWFVSPKVPLNLVLDKLPSF
jgi:hypothetical protein